LFSVSPNAKWTNGSLVLRQASGKISIIASLNIQTGQKGPTSPPTLLENPSIHSGRCFALSGASLKPTNMCVADRAEIAHDVLAYMYEHSAAQDTLEGIVEWWLLEQKIDRNIAEVKGVLSELAAKRFIVEYRTADSRVHYRINRRKKKEILAFLNR
jgi:hypothetical protein